MAAPDRPVPVIDAAAMHNSATSACTDADIFTAAAAVADYRPISVADQKIKKQSDNLELTLEKTVDIVSHIAESQPSLCSWLCC